MNHELNSFETKLLAELQDVVAERSHSTVTAPSSMRSRRWLAVAAAALLVAGATTLSLTQAAPAFALDPAEDGSIQVTINRLEDAEGLETALRNKGINADVTYTPPGKACAPNRAAMAPNPLALSVAQDDAGGATFRLSPDATPDGSTLLLETDWVRLDGQNRFAGFRVTSVTGHVTPCTLVDAPVVEGQPFEGDGGPGEVIVSNPPAPAPTDN